MVDHPQRGQRTDPSGSGWLGLCRNMDGQGFNFFGRIFLVRREAGLWQACALGSDGKRAPAGFIIPEFVEDGELEQYLYDLFHESATPGSGDVRRMP